MSDNAVSPIDAPSFRTVLGHFPTGVCVVTAIDAAGTPVGMAVGSFTSVSLDPPLVAFLPDRSSTTFPRIRDAVSFCVNVLAADQEPVCRTFASRGADKFATVSWRPAPSGAPILDGVVAWIDCVPDTLHEAGDHYICIGRVTDLAVENPTLPLLFFQGGYGAFSLGSLVVGARPGLTEHLVRADRARDEMERLADRTGVEVLALAPSGDTFVLVASASPDGTASPHRIGMTMPLAPPAGRVFVAWEGRERIEQWFARSVEPLTEQDRMSLDQELAAVRESGWTPAFSSERLDDLWQTIGRIGQVGQTPSLVRHVTEAITHLERHSTPDDVTEDTAGSVQAVMAPVFGPDGDVVLKLSLTGIPRGATLERIHELRDELLAACARVTEALNGRPPRGPAPAR
ncbi:MULTISPECIES: flavin reductase [unclassified Microbacterium]|uniref:flavin reductase n=1 Tax=unclassified Microbacterium TaxID=2609290 RepID=UPI00214B309B|nr:MULTISPECIES: flavin reductase [unclassified Microbacterium]MCR2783428.1 flavin reductase [Microbacterium sp. zg.B96]WIM15704.1 flavin reductase [Microbacterium sp. zg-B96]